MAQKSKQKKNSTEGYITEAPYANPVNCEYVESAMQAPIDPAPQSAKQEAMFASSVTGEYITYTETRPGHFVANVKAHIDPAPESAMQDDGLRKIPAGMNRNNTEQDFLILILESLYRIEKKLGA